METHFPTHYLTQKIFLKIFVKHTLRSIFFLLIFIKIEIMKVVTHKFQKTKDHICYLVNLVDFNGRPLESHVANNSKEKVDLAEEIAEKYKVLTVFHNSGFSLIE